MSRYTIGWLLWLAWFVIEEGSALCGPRNGRTLSEHCWAWFSLKEKGHWWRARRFAALAFLCWLSAHLLTGGAF